jgi:chemotaxis protein methyltransferase CheR
MTEEEYLLLNETISERFGLHFPEHKREILESRLRPRLEACRLRNFFDYYLLLKADRNGEMAQLAHLVSNNETYFFREEHQFESLMGPGLEALRTLLPSKRKLKILSAGCSSGEEPYTLRIFARERYLQDEEIEIDAFDIDRQRIKRAKAAVYNPYSLRAASPERVERYFRRLDGDRFELREAYREGVSFRIGNIVDSASYPMSGSYDALFCRNVLIYFSETALHRALKLFLRALRPGGLLFLGHSESAIGLSPELETLRLGRSLIYRRVTR